MIKVKPGQVWRRKIDGTETVVAGVDPQWFSIRDVRHKARRLTWTRYENFILKYEFVSEGEPCDQ